MGKTQTVSFLLTEKDPEIITFPKRLYTETSPPYSTDSKLNPRVMGEDADTNDVKTKVPTNEMINKAIKTKTPKVLSDMYSTVHSSKNVVPQTNHHRHSYEQSNLNRDLKKIKNK